MDPEITGLCRDHSFEGAADLCRRCGMEFCEDCLVQPRGSDKSLCKECAMVQGGVRVHSPRPALPGRLVRKRLKAFEAKLASLAPRPESDGPALVDPVLQDWLDSTDADSERTKAPAQATETEPAIDEPPDAQPAPTLSTTDEPADGVAPPIDWNKPFG